MRIVWKGYFEGNSGYIQCTKTLPELTEAAGFETAIIPFKPISEDNPLTKYIIKEKREDDIIILHQIPATNSNVDGFYTVTEFNRVHPTWEPLLSNAKVLITQTEFCKKIFSKIEGINQNKIFVLPPKIHLDGNCLVDVSMPEGYIFGSVFEWVARKAPQRMWQAFMEEFPLEDYPNVYFINKFTIPFNFKNWKWFYNKFTNKDPRIFFIDKHYDDISEFYASIDCYCSPTAGEGFGMTLAEAMGYGLPTIGSNHSGNLDFMNNDNSFLVDVEDWSYVGNDPTNSMSHLITPYLKWKMPSVKSIREQMRIVYDNKDDIADKKGYIAAQDMKVYLSEEKMIHQLQDAFSKYL